MRGFSIEHRLGFFYAAIFASIGASAPFLSLWLDSRGIAPSMIGVIVAAPSIAMVATTVSIGRFVDHLNDRRRGIVLLNAGVLAANGVLLWAHGFWSVLLIWTLGGLLMHAILPIADAFALGITQRRGSDWARVRLAGSAGFVGALLIAGPLYERIGISAFLPVLIVGAVGRLFAALALPSEHAGSERSLSRDTSETLEISSASISGRLSNCLLYRPVVMLTITGAALINASHALFYAFGLLIWTRAGMSESTGSLFWVLGVVAEMGIMWRFRSIATKVSARVCLFIAGSAGVIRWTLSLSEPTLPLLVLIQCLHALTFGLGFLATASFIARRVDPRNAARGQALSATITTGAMAVATTLGGIGYEQIGSQAYIGMVVLAASGMLLVALSYRYALEAV